MHGDLLFTLALVQENISCARFWFLPATLQPRNGAIMGQNSMNSIKRQPYQKRRNIKTSLNLMARMHQQEHHILEYIQHPKNKNKRDIEVGIQKRERKNKLKSYQK